MRKAEEGKDMIGECDRLLALLDEIEKRERDRRMKGWRISE